jgi:hypothetical protein
MKKQLLNLTLLLIAFTAVKAQSNQKTIRKINPFAQSANRMLANDYTFSVLTGTYANLANTISVNNNTLWDDPEVVMPIGFNFPFFNTTVSNIYLGVGLGATLSDTVDANYECNFLIAGFEADLIDRGDISGVSQSPISYKVDGIAGSRIFKLEFNNAGFFNEGSLNNTLNDFVNVQFWLYEGSGNIEIHYGPSLITDSNVDYDGDTGAIIGISDFAFTNSYFLNGPVASPSLVASIDVVDGTPANGTIYKFTKSTTGIRNFSTNEAVSVYPNPMTNATTLKLKGQPLENGQLVITDALGKTVKVMANIQTKNILIEKEEMNAGIYFYHLTDNNKIVAAGKLIVE